MQQRPPGNVKRYVRLLAQRLLARKPIRVVARELGWSPSQARLLEGHLLRGLEREAERVKALAAWSAAGDL